MIGVDSEVREEWSGIVGRVEQVEMDGHGQERCLIRWPSGRSWWQRTICLVEVFEGGIQT